MIQQDLQKYLNSDYQFGSESNIENETFAQGLNEVIVTAISNKKNEPDWLLAWRLKAYRNWLNMKTPQWSNLEFPEINYQKISYYSEPKDFSEKKLEDLDPAILDTFKRLGIPLKEQEFLAGVAVDLVLDSVSIKTTFQKKLTNLGIVFCPISEAISSHPDLVKRYLGSVVPPTDNFFACLNSAVFSDGTFVYVPANTICPIELSTYFRINAQNTGQFERTLIIVEDSSSVSYLEGCSAPIRPENQLHAAVVEIIALDKAEVKYSTVQNWYPGDKNGVGGIYNFVTKRGLCAGNNSKISWTQMEVGSAITWKYPSVILKGDGSVGEFYSVALTNNHQQADTGTKMIHIGSNTKSRIISKGISSGKSKNTYRGIVKIARGAKNTKNFSRCDSLLLGDESFASTLPKIVSSNSSSQIEHEATTSKISSEILFYLQTRGLSEDLATSLIVNGFIKEVVKNLPMEFAVEAQKLLELKLENTVG